MSKKNYTHIAVVMDRSGSMSNIAQDMEGGVRSLIDAQKLIEGNATITLARFDTSYDVVYDFVDIKDATDFRLEPRGSTALLDAMGMTLESVRNHIVQMDAAERPEKVMFIFITDGGENASHEFTRARVLEMISDLTNADEQGLSQEDENGITWDFRFLGANQDAIAEGGGYGIRASASLNYCATSDGSATMFDSLTRSISDYRTKGVKAANFTEEDRKAQEAPANPTIRPIPSGSGYGKLTIP